MNAAGKRVDIEIYDGAGHAFENPSNQRGYRPKAAAVAWFDILKFFEQANGSTSRLIGICAANDGIDLDLRDRGKQNAAANAEKHVDLH